MNQKRENHEFLKSIGGGGRNYLSKNPQWSSVLAKAKVSTKPIFVFGHTTWCGYCREMETVMATAEAGNVYNQAFINVSYDLEKGEGLKLKNLYNITAFPALIYFNSNGEAVDKNVGATDITGLLGMGRNSRNPRMQFYTLKKPALSGEIEPLDPSNWAGRAEYMDEPKVEQIITAYLAKQPSILKREGLLELVLNHEGLPTETQMRELFDYSDKSKKNADLRNFLRGQLLKKLSVIAYNKSYNNQTKMIDFNIFKAEIARYQPGAAALETHKQKIIYYDKKRDYSRVITELDAMFLQPELKPGAHELSILMKEHAVTLRMHNVLDDFIKKVTAYKLSTADKGRGYYKQLALIFMYNENRDQKMVNQIAKLIIADPNEPNIVKEEAIFLAD